MAKQTIKEITNRIEASLPEISVIAANGEVLASETMLGMYLRRIFNNGEKTDGSKIGKYSEKTTIKLKSSDIQSLNKMAQKRLKSVNPTNEPIRYIETRKIAGRQVQYIDFQFTDRLFKSIEIGNLNGRPAVGITDADRVEVSYDLEKRFGVVFTPSEEERRIALETARYYTFEKLKELMKTWS